MSAGRKIGVMLAGPYPHAGGMTGTYGRILGNLQSSAVFEAEVDFFPHRSTLPADGNLVKRQLVDLGRAARSLRRKPNLLHFIMQKYRALYREFPIIKAAGALGVKTILDVRAGTLQAMLGRNGHRLQNGMMNNLLRTADALVLECKKDVAFVEERFGRTALHLPNVALAADFGRIRPAAALPDGERPIRLIHSGRYAKFKGTTLLLESLKFLSRKGVRAELHLTGQGNDPEVLRAITASVQDPPAGMIVVDHGWDVPDLYELMASGHLFVMISDWMGEGHPNVVTEAMMAGLGMVLSDWLHREDIVPPEGAIIVPARDPEALADAIARYANEPGLLARAREVNRRWVEEHYLDRVCYPRLLDLYKRLHVGGAGQ